MGNWGEGVRDERKAGEYSGVSQREDMGNWGEGLKGKRKKREDVGGWGERM